MDLFSNSNTLQEKNPAIVKYISGMEMHLGSWYQPLRSIVDSEMFYCTLEEVFRESYNGKIILPPSRNIFRAFRECPYNDLKIVFVGQDPYHQVINNVPVADGLAFSCSNTGKEQPSLNFILNEVQRTAYHYKFARQSDLTHWANQGILLLNTALTVEQSKPDSHTQYWKEFITSVLNHLNNSKENLIFVFFGRKAQAFTSLINSTRHHKLNVVHPAAAAHRGGVWDCEDVFNKCNNILKESLKETIIW